MILLRLLSPESDRFENDIRAIIMSFYLGEKICTPRQKFPEEEPLRAEIRLRAEDGQLRLAASEGAVYTGSALPFEKGDRKKERDQIKTGLYRLLCFHTGQRLPWGTLTGVRPAKIPMEMYREGGSRRDAAAFLQEKYFVSEEKAQLCAEIAERELDVLGRIKPEKAFSIYIGIPFCPSICAYCSFSSYPIARWQERTDEYLTALEKEIEAVSRLVKKRTPMTLYMGGGTPTSISAAQLDRLLGTLSETFDFSGIQEITVEAGRPDSITLEKLQVLARRGVSRISINPQTMNQRTLDLIGRRHSTEQVKEAFAMARQTGFQNINMDLIAGLPGEKPEDMRRTMEEVCALQPDSITVHSLALKRAAFLNRNRDLFPSASAREVNEMIRISREAARGLGMHPYYIYRQKNIAGNLENTGYAENGCEGLYNILIMEEKQTILALGSGGMSKFLLPGPGGSDRLERVENVKSVDDYIGRIDEMIRRKEVFIHQHADELGW